MMKPFAVIDGSFNSFTVFRNAQPDSVTLCAGDYLTGSTGDNNRWVYWSGGHDVRFTKIDGFGERLVGAQFTLYTEYACQETQKYRRASVPVTATSVDENSGIKDEANEFLNKGDVLFSQIPDGYYFLLEDTPIPDNRMNAYTKDADGNPVANKYLVRVGHKRLTYGPRPQGMSDDFWALLGELPAQQSTEPEVQIYLVGKDDNGGFTLSAAPGIGIINCSKAMRKVILQRVDTDNKAVSGKTFDLYYCDGHVVNTRLKTGPGGVIWVGTLPFGKYYLHERGEGNNEDVWYTVTVNMDSVNGYGVVPVKLDEAPNFNNSAP